MVGLEIPVIPVEHQYIVTEPHPEIQKRKKEGLPEMGVLRDSDSRWYMREEAGGLILGPYEDGAPACYVEGPSKESEYTQILLMDPQHNRLVLHLHMGLKLIHLLLLSYTICYHYLSKHPSQVILLFFFFEFLDEAL